MRVTTVFKRLLRLDDVNVVDVEWFARLIVVTVLRRVGPDAGKAT